MRTSFCVLALTGCVTFDAIERSDGSQNQQLPVGQACSAATDCPSKFCVDGVCCDEGCVGACVRCDAPASLGSCTLVVGVPAVDHGFCGGLGVCAGVCDGTSRGCHYPNFSVRCGDSCEGSCDGTGGCGFGGVCPDRFACKADACKTSCSDATDCRVPNICVNGACIVP